MDYLIFLIKFVFFGIKRLFSLNYLDRAEVVENKQNEVKRPGQKGSVARRVSQPTKGGAEKLG